MQSTQRWGGNLRSKALTLRQRGQTLELRRGWQLTAVWPVLRELLPSTGEGAQAKIKEEKRSLSSPFDFWIIHPKINRVPACSVDCHSLIHQLLSHLCNQTFLRCCYSSGLHTDAPCRCPTQSSVPQLASLVPSDAIVYVCHLSLCY